MCRERAARSRLINGVVTTGTGRAEKKEETESREYLPGERLRDFHKAKGNTPNFNILSKRHVAKEMR